MKKFLSIFIMAFIILWSCVFAQSVIPEWESNDNAWSYVSGVSVWWKVLEMQKDLAWHLSLPDQFKTWIMNWDTILDYSAYLVKFLWELALFAWAVAIIFLWYKRITKNVLWESPKGLVMVIVWVLVVIFAYVIVKLIWSAFIS